MAKRTDCDLATIGLLRGIGYNVVMVTLNAHFDGTAIVPDERPGFPPGTRLRVTVESIEQTSAPDHGRLDLPLLTGVDPRTACTIMQDPEYEIESVRMDRFLDHHGPQRT